MKKLLFLFSLIFVSCSSSSSDDINPEMALNIVNEFSKGEIVRVEWTGGNGLEVIIPTGSSRRVVLQDIPDASLLDVRIVMKCLGSSAKTLRVAVNEGQTTTITAKEQPDTPSWQNCCSCYDLIKS